MGVSRVIMLGVCALTLVMALLLHGVFGWRALVNSIVTKEPLARRVVRFAMTSDWSRAAAICTGLPFLFIGVALSVVNRMVQPRLCTAPPAARPALTPSRVVHGPTSCLHTPAFTPRPSHHHSSPLAGARQPLPAWRRDALGAWHVHHTGRCAPAARHVQLELDLGAQIADET